jgi:tetratricopeptide (TPR) repeat protein
MLQRASGTLMRLRRIAPALACALLAACSQPPVKLAPEGTTAVIEANRKADNYFRNGNLNNAARYYLEAIRLAQAVEDADGIAANAVNLSIVQQRLGRYAQARASLALILDQRGKLIFPQERLSQAALRRAVLDMDEQQFSSAAEWVERAANYCGRSSCPLLAGIHNVRGQLALESGQIEAATASAKAALSASRGTGDRAETGNALRLLGLAALRKGDAAAALGFLDEALVIDRELALPRKIYLDLVGLGRAKASSGERDAARSFYERALTVSDADRDLQGTAAARALIEGLGEKAGVSGSIPAAKASSADR